jgi:hypothetical protein
MNTGDADNKFLEDFDEETLKELDRRLEMPDELPYKPLDPYRNVPRGPTQALDSSALVFPAAPAKSSAPSIAKSSVPSVAKPDRLPQSSDEGGAIGFLAELEQEVAALNQEGTSSAEYRRKSQQVHEALFSIFTFLNQMSRHANVLAPEISRPYRLDVQTEYTGLRWQDAFVSFRKQSMSENAFLSHVSFRVRLVAQDPITMVRRWDLLDPLKRDLHILDVRIVDELCLTKKPGQEFVELKLAPDFPVQLHFKGNYATHRIDVISRNLEGFGILAFDLDIGSVNQTLLDELGRFLLCRSNELPEALHRVTYKPNTKNDQ